jgi:hypothetical protein
MMIIIISPKDEKIAYTDTSVQAEERVIYICDLCDNQFKNEEELSRHVSANH